MRLRLPLVFVVFLLFAPDSARSLEPATALDDGFAAPSPSTLAEASLSYPGIEAFISRPFSVVAWSAPFGMNDLAVTTAAAGGRIGGAGVFFSYTGTGFDLYGDDQERLGIALPFGSRLAAGARVTRSALRIRGFGDASVWSADLGAVFRPVPDVFLSASFEDLAGAELGESKEPLDGRSRFAASWRIPGTATILASVTKVRRFDPSLSAGVLMELSPSLTAGVLGAGEPDRIEFLAAVTRGARFSYRGSFHRDLGFTHGFSIGWGGRGAAPGFAD